jgi:succinate--hydroxymethylglutarate CoA-transferase
VEMDRRGVPCAPVNDYQQVLGDPSREHGLMRSLTLPNGVETRTVAFPVAIAGYEFEIYRPQPQLGDHTADVSPSGWSQRRRHDR